VPSKRGGFAVASISQWKHYVFGRGEGHNSIFNLNQKYNSKDNESTSEPSIHLQDTI
jgi:hypothetical protein